jgi:SH3 domain-containing protein
MTAVVASHKSNNLEGHPAGDASGGEQMAPPDATSRAAAASDGSTDGAPTPVYDNLMSMIQATALENGGVPPHNDNVDAAPPLAHRRWQLPSYLIICTAVSIVAGGALLVRGMSLRQPPVVAADRASEEGSRVVAAAASTNQPIEQPHPAPDPGGPAPIDAEGKMTAEAGIGPATEVPAASDERAVATPVAEQPIENPGSGGDGPAEARASAEATRTDPVAPATNGASDQPWPADVLPPERETGSSTADQASTPAANSIVRTVSEVNMRDGPGNSQAVLMIIPRGSPVEVISCRQWCEVAYAGQRGWVYKGFIGAAPTPDRR